MHTHTRICCCFLSTLNEHALIWIEANWIQRQRKKAQQRKRQQERPFNFIQINTFFFESKEFVNNHDIKYGMKNEYISSAVSLYLNLSHLMFLFSNVYFKRILLIASFIKHHVFCRIKVECVIFIILSKPMFNLTASLNNRWIIFGTGSSPMHAQCLFASFFN